ncbi:MAG: tetratricopeptide repeat protein [Planctomycetota bacterium]
MRRFPRVFVIGIAASLLGGCPISWPPKPRPPAPVKTAAQPPVSSRNIYNKVINRPKALTQEEKNLFLGAQMQNNTGSQSMQEGNLNEAANRFTNSLAIVDDYVLPMANLGRTYYLLGKFGLAKDYLDAALATTTRIEPNNVPLLTLLHIDLGNLYRQSDQMEQAQQEYYAALQLTPDFPRAHFELGNLYLKQGQWESALERFNRTLELDASPDYDSARLGRAIAQHSLGRDLEAWQDILELERRGYQVNENLKNTVVESLRQQREAGQFRPGS